MTGRDIQLSRRTFLQGTAELVIGLYLVPIGGAAAQRVAPGVPFTPNAFVRIGMDDIVTVIVKHTEMGQGPLTGLTTLVAEELDADWSQMRAQEAPANAALYNNLTMGPAQGTAGSTAIANSYQQMRKAGATARAMLVLAAANSWGVPAAEVSVERGVLRHALSKRSGRFGEFAVAASRLPVPQDAPLKDPSAFRLIGREGAVKRIDTLAKTNGTALFTFDIHEPGMLTVVVAHPPRFGAKVVSVDATAAQAVEGVVAVKQIPSGVAVYANGTWPALKGRDRLKITWDESEAERRSTEQILDELKSLARQPGAVANVRGDPDAFLNQTNIIESEYVFPYLAHAPMEPLDGFMVWDGKRVKSRHGSQLQTPDQMQIAGLFGIEPDAVEIETMLAGGGFGRRIDSGNDMLADLAGATQAIGPNRPIKLIWSREDDIRGGFYRSMFVHRLRGAIRNGRIVAWGNTIVGQSFIIGTSYAAGYVHNGIDLTMVLGAVEIPYDIPNFRCDVHVAKVGVPTKSWRSVSGTHTCYAVECFIDKLLDAVGQDPVSGRLALMDKSSRHAGVLRAVAELAQWSGPGPTNGRARGVAVAEQSGSFIAQIAEVSVEEGGPPRVHKVWCAIDCGVVVNPDVVRAQMEGGIGFGLGHVLYAEVGLDKGQPIQSNFHNYRSLRISEMPQVQVRIVNSTAPPTGVGEGGVPPIGPAVANALAKLGRERPGRLPMVRADTRNGKHS
jgi:isoquinoline 1-oxidoreductase subunit beta